MFSVIRHCLAVTRNQIVKIFNILPLKESILFESNPDFNDESYWLCKGLIENNLLVDKKIIWILKDRRSVERIPGGWDIDYIFARPRSIREWCKKHIVLHTTKYIFDSCAFVNKSRKEQKRLYLAHFGMFIKDISKYMRDIGKYDFISCGSSHFLKQYLALGIDEKKMLFFGNMRLDRLYIQNDCLKLIIPESNIYRMKFIWMPTYRQHNTSNEAPQLSKETDNKTGFPILYSENQFQHMNELLNSLNYLLVIKVHPSQNISFLRLNQYSNIKVLVNDDLEKMSIPLYDIINNFDALITDYSSIYYDYLLLERPIALTVDDIEEYKKNVGFAVDYKKEIIGEYIHNEDEFRSFFENIESYNTDRIIEAKYSYHDITDGKSAERFIAFAENVLFQNN